tara:strand:- start:603 stop:821 length:219 start_codon:yes stop_codon:yes gene_type:complete
LGDLLEGGVIMVGKSVSIFNCGLKTSWCSHLKSEIRNGWIGRGNSLTARIVRAVRAMRTLNSSVPVSPKNHD